MTRNPPTKVQTTYPINPKTPQTPRNPVKVVRVDKSPHTARMAMYQSRNLHELLRSMRFAEQGLPGPLCTYNLVVITLS